MLIWPMSFMLFQQYSVVQGNLEGGGLMKALIDGVVHSAGLVQVLTVREVIEWKEVLHKWGWMEEVMLNW